MSTAICPSSTNEIYIVNSKLLQLLFADDIELLPGFWANINFTLDSSLFEINLYFKIVSSGP